MIFALILLTLLLSAFFSGAEIAYLAADPFRIELQATRGERAARWVSGSLKQPGRFITTLLIGNNIALVLYGVLMARILEPTLLDSLGWTREANTLGLLALQTLISTSLVLLFGEFLPKAIFRLNPNRSLLLSAWVLRFFYLLLRPLVGLFEASTRLVLRSFFGVETQAGPRYFGRADLFHFLRDHLGQQTAQNPELDPEIFENAMEFNETRVREFMVPRTEIVAVQRETPVEELLRLFIETELSRILVYDDNLDDVIGYVHVFDMLRRPAQIQEVLHELMVVPESMPANNLLTAFTEKQKAISLVVDEFGGTAGLVTVEDLVEEIFGEIEDEHDEEDDDEWIEERINPYEFRFSARLEVEYINRTYELDLPEGDFTTLSGLVMHYAERIPSLQETIEVGPYHFVVESANATHPEVLRLKISFEGQ